MGRRIEPMQWMSLGLVVVLGGATMLTQSPRFMMIKPTIVHFAVAAVMLRPGWMIRAERARTCDRRCRLWLGSFARGARARQSVHRSALRHRRLGVVHLCRLGWYMEITSNPVPTKRNPLGAKGAGEAGTVGALPAIVNAVVGALAPLGVKSLDMPATSECIWQAMRDARA